MAWSLVASCADPRLRPHVLLGSTLRSGAGGAQHEAVPSLHLVRLRLRVRVRVRVRGALVATQLATHAACGARLRVWAAPRTAEAHLLLRPSGTVAAYGTGAAYGAAVGTLTLALTT